MRQPLQRRFSPACRYSRMACERDVKISQRYRLTGFLRRIRLHETIFHRSHRTVSALPIVLRTLVPPVIVLAVLAGIGWVLLWLAFTPQSFGGWDPRVLFFVRGTWTDRIGIIEPNGALGTTRRKRPTGLASATCAPATGRKPPPTQLSPPSPPAAAGSGSGDAAPGRRAAAEAGEKFLVCSKGDLTIGMKVAGQDVFVWRTSLSLPRRRRQPPRVFGPDLIIALTGGGQDVSVAEARAFSRLFRDGPRSRSVPCPHRRHARRDRRAERALPPPGPGRRFSARSPPARATAPPAGALRESGIQERDGKKGTSVEYH